MKATCRALLGSPRYNTIHHIIIALISSKRRHLLLRVLQAKKNISLCMNEYNIEMNFEQAVIPQTHACLIKFLLKETVIKMIKCIICFC